MGDLHKAHIEKYKPFPETTQAEQLFFSFFCQNAFSKGMSRKLSNFLNKPLMQLNKRSSLRSSLLGGE